VESDPYVMNGLVIEWCAHVVCSTNVRTGVHFFGSKLLMLPSSDKLAAIH
jgi:hypothetical protein